MKTLRVSPAPGPLSGRVRVPGDKSISHRAVMLAAVAEGESRVRNLLRSDDVQATVRAFQSLGVEIADQADEVVIRGRGHRGLRSPAAPLDLGNSGTSMRLLAGLLAGLPVEVTLVGDPSLSERPMGRVVEPLRLMAAEIAMSERGTAPLRIRGRSLRAIQYRLPVASAQVKSALLLAGLFAEGRTRLAEPQPTRDHTERMLPGFGVKLEQDSEWIVLEGGQRLIAAGAIEVPGDLSSAAFFLVAALTVPGSELVIENVGLNPTRTGVLEILERMGANIRIENRRELGAEPAGDLRVTATELTAVEVNGSLVPRTIDELPVLCVAAALARGRTVIRDARELRVKESDRIAAMAELLGAMGVSVREFEDGLEIHGPAALHGTRMDCRYDHRVAMAAAVAGLAARGVTEISDAECIGTSFPGFDSCLTALVR